jgi:hypothetical protein
MPLTPGERESLSHLTVRWLKIYRSHRVSKKSPKKRAFSVQRELEGEKEKRREHCLQ